MQTATFAAGCFWGIEAKFRKIKGVQDAKVGYTGGWFQQPTYQDVCAGNTEHAEAVEVIFDPEQVSYPELLQAFWEMHDPTTFHRQGPDVGSQYRSAIFFHSPEQENAAQASKAERQKLLGKRIVTEIVPAAIFYPAEDYHQRYYEKRGISHCGF